MDLVEGMPVTKYCDQNDLTISARLELFVPICQAVQHAHQKGIIHRDIKPTNVIVMPNEGVPVPKIIDFGVAKATNQRLTERTAFTHDGQMLGTPLYMSPEQAAQSADVDTRSDIYSLGVLLYELLTGTTPFERERLQDAGYDEIYSIIREEDPPRPSTRISALGEAATTISAHRVMDPAKLSRSLRGELDWIVMKALQKDRDERYATALDLAEDVRRFLDNEPILAKRASLARRAVKWSRRHKPIVWSAAVMLVFTTVGLAVSNLLVKWEKDQKEVALKAREAALIQKDHALKQSKTSEARALTEAARANAVINLVTDMLGSANPAAAPGPDYTLGELLEDFSCRMGDQLAGQPEVDADVHLIMGSIYSSLHLHEQADRHFQVALKQGRRVFGKYDPRLARILKEYSWHLIRKREPAAAEDAARELLEINRSKGFPHGVLGAMHRLVAASVQQGKHAEAESLARQALAYSAETGTQRTESVAYILRQWATVKTEQQKLIEAKSLLLRALEISRHARSRGEGGALLALGRLSEAQGDYEGAEARFREALALMRATSSDRYHGISNALKALLSLLDKRGDQEGVAQLRQEYAGIAGLEEVVKPASDSPVQRWVEERMSEGELITAVEQLMDLAYPEIDDALFEVAKSYREMPKKIVVLESFAARADAAPKHSRALARTYTKLADSQWQVGNTSDAEAYYRKALSIQEKLVGAFPSAAEYRHDLAYSWQGVAGSLRAEGRNDEAMHAGQKALVLWEELADEYSDNVGYRRELAHIHNELGDLLEASGQHERARQAYRRGIELHEQLTAELPQDVECCLRLAWNHTSLGQLLQTRGRIEESAQAYHRAVENYSKAAEVEDTDSRPWHFLAMVHLVRGDADAYKRTCAAMLGRFQATHDPFTAEITAYTCALAPDAVEDFNPAIELGRKRLGADQGDVVAHKTLGAILYRAGCFPEAVEHLGAADRLMAENDKKAWSWPAELWYFLALAHQSSGNGDEAKAWLRKAAASTDQVLAEPDGDTGAAVPWNRRLILKRLRAEAAELLNATETSSAVNEKTDRTTTEGLGAEEQKSPRAETQQKQLASADP
jgi:tetratricopeptide (TPR) repeat protein